MQIFAASWMFVFWRIWGHITVHAWSWWLWQHCFNCCCCLCRFFLTNSYMFLYVSLVVISFRFLQWHRWSDTKCLLIFRSFFPLLPLPLPFLFPAFYLHFCTYAQLQFSVLFWVHTNNSLGPVRSGSDRSIRYTSPWHIGALTHITVVLRLRWLLVFRCCCFCYKYPNWLGLLLLHAHFVAVDSRKRSLN